MVGIQVRWELQHQQLYFSAGIKDHSISLYVGVLLSITESCDGVGVIVKGDKIRTTLYLLEYSTAKNRASGSLIDRCC